MFTLAKRKFEEETGLQWSDPSYLPWLEKLVEEKFTSTNKQSTQNYACAKCSAELTVTEYRSGECYSCCSSISA